MHLERERHHDKCLSHKRAVTPSQTVHPTDLRALHVSHDEIDSDTYFIVHVLLYDVINFHISCCEIRHLMNSAP